LRHGYADDPQRFHKPHEETGEHLQIFEMIVSKLLKREERVMANAEKPKSNIYFHVGISIFKTLAFRIFNIQFYQ
jgi:hypothetical protein